MSFSVTQRQRSAPVLPLAALVDVLFLLLVFFMTTSLYREQDLFVEVAPPAMGSGTTGSAGTSVNITIDENDRIYIGDREYDITTLRRTLVDLNRQFPDEWVVVRGDRKASHGRVMEVRDAAFEANFTRVLDGVVRRASEIAP